MPAAVKLTRLLMQAQLDLSIYLLCHQLCQPLRQSPHPRLRKPPAARPSPVRHGMYNIGGRKSDAAPSKPPLITDYPATFLTKPFLSSNPYGCPCPRRRVFEDAGEDGAIRLMRSGQIAEAHQELIDDLSAGKTEGLAKKPRPLVRRSRVVRVEPTGERSMRLPQRLDSPGILGRRFYLESIADDPRIGEQAIGVSRSEGGNAIDLEIRERSAKRRTLFEDRQPGQDRLVYLEHEPLEQHALVGGGKAMLGLMIEAVDRMAGRQPAIGGAHLSSRGN